jgi:hypothetical protein
MGLPPEIPLSRLELRRRRDRLMIVHHPDRGGDERKAARINATYARMVDWLDSRPPGEAERKVPDGSSGAVPADMGGVYKSTLKAAFHAGAAQFCAVALVALAAYAAFRGNKKP